MKKTIIVVGLAVVCVSFAYAGIDDGLVAHWTMDDSAANSTVVDAFGGLNGTFYSGMSSPNTNLHHSNDFIKGTGSLSFDGVDDYVRMPRNTELETGNSVTKQFSVSAWIKSDFAGVPSKFTTIAGTGDGGWFLGSFPNENKLFFVCWLTSGNTSIVTVDIPVFDEQWHNVVGVYDGSKAHIYVDGNHGEGTSYGGTIRNINNKGVLIGENAGATGRYWDGLIDDVRIYNTAITPEPCTLLLLGFGGLLLRKKP